MAELTYRGAVARGDRPGDGARPDRSSCSARTSARPAACSRRPRACSTQFGPERVRDTPISEQAIIGAAMGAAMTGLRPVAELMFSDFFGGRLGHGRQPDRQDALHDRRPGRAAARDPHGQRRRACASARSTARAIENWAMAIPGLKVVAPSNPADMVGLMAAAIRDPDPVIVCEHKALFADKARRARRRASSSSSGEAKVLREGTDATVVALAAMVPRALAAAETLAAETASSSRSSTCARSSRSTSATVLASVEKTSAPVHGRGEPAAVRLGRRGRLDRRRGGDLLPRRRRSCGSPRRTCRCRGEPGRSRTPACRRPSGSPTTIRTHARGRRVTRSPCVGCGRMGSAMARALARSGPDLVLYNRTPDRARGPGRRSSARDGRRRRPRRRDAPTSASRCSPTGRRCATVCGRARRARWPARTTGAVLVDMSTVPPRHRVARSRPRVRAPAPASSTPRSRAASPSPRPGS